MCGYRMTNPNHRSNGDMAMTTDQQDALLERYGRLRRAARAVVDGCEAAGDPDKPRCVVEPHLVRTLRRELDGDPQPSTFAWMSPS